MYDSTSLVAKFLENVKLLMPGTVQDTVTVAIGIRTANRDSAVG